MAWINCTACGNNPPRLEDALGTTLQESSAAIGENNTDCLTFFFQKYTKKLKILRGHFNSRVSMFVNCSWGTYTLWSWVAYLFHYTCTKLIHIFVHNKFLRRYIYVGCMGQKIRKHWFHRSITVWAYGSNWSSEVEHPVLYRHQQPDVPMKAFSGAWWFHITETLTNNSVTFI